MKLEELETIIPWQELEVIQKSRELRKVIQDMANRIDHIPIIYETEGNGEAQCVLHYFDTLGSADWYVFELDLETGEAFGFTTLSGDIADPYAEFGYFDLSELCKMARTNLDLHFAGITKKEILHRRKTA